MLSFKTAITVGDMELKSKHIVMVEAFQYHHIRTSSTIFCQLLPKKRMTDQKTCGETCVSLSHALNVQQFNMQPIKCVYVGIAID